MSSSAGYGRSAQTSIYRGGATGSKPAVPSSARELEAAARRAMSAEAWAYIAGSAGSESTARANRTSLDRWRLVPRMLRDVSTRDLSIELFGRRYDTPVIAAPVGVLELAHKEADFAVAKATAGLGVPFVFSNQASVPMESTAAVMGDAPHWFQLYWSSSDELVASLVRRAEASGAQAIVITLDTHMLGWRPRDLDLAYLPFIRGMGLAQYTSDPVFRELVRERAAAPAGEKPRVTPTAVRTLFDMARRYPGRFGANLRSGEPRAAVETFLDVFSRSSLEWQHIEFVRQHTALPIVLKGVQHVDDAKRAIQIGVDGIVVSNHGGRQVDGAVGSADALVPIVDAVAGRVPVLFDSGVRSGADIVKALALGAAAVLVGRPYVYGLSVAGEAGVREVLRNLVAELDLTLGLTGHASIAELTRDSVVAS
ncbi:MAG: alpha-hydroxy-acid oxidizing protein [Cryobacterium sp.]|nr:alpha-hydroxy-acid oxidizing protein [Cryobacterium sp.]